MLKVLLFGGLACIGLFVIIALYAAIKITKMGKAMGQRPSSSEPNRTGYITTTGTTLTDPKEAEDE